MSFADWTWVHALWLLILVWSNTAGGCHSRYGIAPSRTTIHTGWFSSRQGHRTRLITGFNGSKSKQTLVSHGLVHIGSSSNHWQEVDAWLKQSKVRVCKREFWNCHCFINGNLICCTMLPGSIRLKSKYQVVAFSKDGESAEMIIWNDWE